MSAQEWFDKGVALSKEGKWQEALEAYGKAIEIDAKYGAAWYNKGVALGRLGRDEDALKAYEEALEIDPQLAPAWVNKGVALGRLGRDEEALKAYHKALEIEPRYAKAWYNKGVALGRLGRYKDALKAYEEALEIDPQLAPAWVNKGDALGELGRHEEELEAYGKALEIDPQDADAWYNKGVALGGLGRDEDEIEAYDKALEIDPRYAEAWNNKGITLGELGKHQESLKAFETALEINPEDADAWNNKGVVSHELGNLREAMEAYERAIEIKPAYALAYANLAETLFHCGNFEEASANVEEALAAEPTSVRASLLKGRLKIEETDYEGAVDCFKDAICSDLGNPRPLLWHAYARYLKVEFSLEPESTGYGEGLATIIRELERACALCKGEKERETKAYILYFLGCFYFKNKDNYAALERLEECVKLESKISPAAYGLLNDIWNYKIRPAWWRWWLFSPSNRQWKRISFASLLGSVIALVGLHPFISVFFPRIEVNWILYGGFILLLVALLALPSLERIKAKDIEVELRSPVAIEPVFSPSVMEAKLKELEA